MKTIKIIYDQLKLAINLGKIENLISVESKEVYALNDYNEDSVLFI